MSEENIWSDFAKSYDIVLRNLDIYQKLRDRIVDSVKGNVVLDAGCGTGIIAIAIAEKGKTVYGRDDNKDMLDYAINRAEEESIENLDLGIGSVDSLEFESGFFDSIVMNNVLFYVEDPVKALKEAHRVLKNKGRIILSGPKPEPNISKLAAHSFEYLRREGLLDKLRQDCDHFMKCSIALQSGGIKNVYHAEELADILKTKAGFSRIVESDEKMYLGENYFVVSEK